MTNEASTVERPCSESERREAVARAVKACTMCPSDLWEELAAHMAFPGVALTLGMVLQSYPESEWAAVVQTSYRLSESLHEILSRGSEPEIAGFYAYPKSQP
jgi:hypothetical protein